MRVYSNERQQKTLTSRGDCSRQVKRCEKREHAGKARMQSRAIVRREVAEHYSA